MFRWVVWSTVYEAVNESQLIIELANKDLMYGSEGHINKPYIYIWYK